MEILNSLSEILEKNVDQNIIKIEGEDYDISTIRDFEYSVGNIAEIAGEDSITAIERFLNFLKNASPQVCFTINKINSSASSNFSETQLPPTVKLGSNFEASDLMVDFEKERMSVDDFMDRLMQESQARLDKEDSRRDAINNTIEALRQSREIELDALKSHLERHVDAVSADEEARLKM